MKPNLSEVLDTESKSGHVHRKLPVSVPSDVKSVELSVIYDRSRDRSAGNETDRKDGHAFCFTNLSVEVQSMRLFHTVGC
jgi:hypothetical protein